MTDQRPEVGGSVRNIRRFIAFLGVFILLVSQFLIFSSPVIDSVMFPPFAWMAILGLVVLVASQFVQPMPFLQKISFSDKAFWILVTAFLSFLATMATANLMLFARINYIPVVTIWFLSAVTYVYAFLNVPLTTSAFFEWIKKNRVEILTVVVVTLFAAGFRLYRLGGIPRVLDGDEGLIGLFAQQTDAGLLANPFSLWENFGTMYLQLINITIKFFGDTAFALRLLPAIGGTLAVPALYVLARRIGGRNIALIAAIALSFSHSHIHFSRIVSVAYIQGTWLAPLELYFLLSGLEKRESWRAAVGGILLAIDFSVYLGAQVIMALVLVYMLVMILFCRSWFKSRLSQAMVFWGGFISTIMPAAFYFIKNPNDFLNRINTSGTFQSGWLAQNMQLTGQSAIQILFGRFVHAFLSLIYYPATDFYGSPSPMLSMVSSALLFVGIIITLWRIRNPAYLLLNGYFWGATFAVGVFATPPSADTYRMLMALPAAMIMVAIGLDQILELLGLDFQNSRTAYTFSVSAILGSLLIFNLWTYYGDFAGHCRFGGDLPGRFASYLGSYVKTIDNESSVYLLSDTYYFYGSHGSTDYLSGTRKIINFEGPIDVLSPVSGETVIASPKRIPELAAWAHDHPGGKINYQYDCKNTILLAYHVP